MRRALPLLLLLALVGCNKDRTKDVIGTWSGGPGGTVTFTEDRKVNVQAGRDNVTGSWRLAGDKVIVTPETVQGKPIAEFKKQVQGMAANLPANMRAKIDEIDKPKTSTLSSDGKTMTSEANGPDGKPATMTKQG
jgi:hypothetical protein